MFVTARLHDLRMAPRKVRLVVDVIRGMKAIPATQELTFSKRAAARPILKLLKSAMANAEQKQLTKESLRIKTIMVNEGATLKRFMPRAFGRSAPIRKRTSHIELMLTGTRPPKKSSSRSARRTTAPLPAPETKPSTPTASSLVKSSSSK